MSKCPTNHDANVRQLRADGCHAELVANAIALRDVPYVDSCRQVKRGTLFSIFLGDSNSTDPPDSHIAYFDGDQPFDDDGTPLRGVRIYPVDERFPAHLRANYLLSCKRVGGDGRHIPDQSHAEKLRRYHRVMSDSVKRFLARQHSGGIGEGESESGNSAQLHSDSGSAPAEIIFVPPDFTKFTVAIIGLGGSGSYTLDLVAKTPVAEIHLFDGDTLERRNASRWPGVISEEVLVRAPMKVEHLRDTYGIEGKQIVAHPYDVDGTCLAELDGMSFVFLSIDSPETKRPIVDHLEKQGIPFVDVGMGITDRKGPLSGTIRVSLSTPDKREPFRKHVNMEAHGDDGVYGQNIQVAELNALNAALAVIKWKKLAGFYLDSTQEYRSTYKLETNYIANKDAAHEHQDN